jgi:8-oxo-dGTP pyrophosphatase MutT (NUDIX family)
MRRKIEGVFAFLEHHGNILLLYRSRGSWTNMYGMPGGHIDTGESPRQALIREVEEETGYDASSDKIEDLGLHQYTTDEGGKFHLTLHIFKILVPKQFEVELNQDEHSGYIWGTPQDLHERTDLVPTLHDLLEKIYHI